MSIKNVVSRLANTSLNYLSQFWLVTINQFNMKKIKLLVQAAGLLLLLSAFSACVEADDSSVKNHLSFKIDGTYWESDAAEVFGSYHVSESLGPKLINIAGAKGSGTAQQAFNINLFNTDTEGTYTVNVPNGSTASTYQNIAQLSNLTSTNYLCGGTLQGSQFTINITKVSQNPQIVEATFSGSMECVEGNTINITDGKFSYHE